MVCFKQFPNNTFYLFKFDHEYLVEKRLSEVLKVLLNSKRFQFTNILKANEKLMPSNFSLTLYITTDRTHFFQLLHLRNQQNGISRAFVLGNFKVNRGPEPLILKKKRKKKASIFIFSPRE